MRLRLPFGRRRHEPPDDAPLTGIRYVVLDTELTSLDKRRNRLLAVGAVAMQGPRILLGEQFYRMVNPGVEVPEAGVVVHGLRPSDVAAGEDPARVLSDLESFIGDAVLVGHFVSIDLAVLRKEFAATGNSLLNSAIDTARVQNWLLRRGPCTDEIIHRLDNLDLFSLAEFYSLEIDAAHHALGDAFLTARLWQKMIYSLEAAGVRSLREALRLARS